jgi:hypothetical protein
VLVWGDSHAADLLPGFRALQHQSGVRLAQYTAAWCSPIIGLSEHGRTRCLSINRAVLERIRILRPDIVVLSCRWENWNSMNSGAKLHAAELAETINAIKDAGVQRVVVIGSAPEWTYDVPALLLNEVRNHPDVPVPHSLPRAFIENHDDSMLRAVTQKAGADYLSLVDNLCDQTSCIAATTAGWQGVVTYDQQHFTAHGSLVVAQRIWPAILRSGK